MSFTVDDQPYRQPKPEPFTLDLKMPFSVIAHEIPIGIWLEAGGEWVETERSGLE